MYKYNSSGPARRTPAHREFGGVVGGGFAVELWRPEEEARTFSSGLLQLTKIGRLLAERFLDQNGRKDSRKKTKKIRKNSRKGSLRFWKKRRQAPKC